MIMQNIDFNNIQKWIVEQFDNSALPSLCDFIRIPNTSPSFDEEWNTNGHLESAAKLISDWSLSQGVEGLTIETLKEPERTPLIFGEIKGDERTLFFYGHFDKQPPFEGWREGHGATIPVIENNRLYGRGGGDDGYSIYAIILAIRALQIQGIPHARCVFIIEGSEESMSQDLPFYVDLLKPRIGIPDIVFCLDSGCATYDSLWLTKSLRGGMRVVLKVSVLTEGIHSMSSGIVPESFTIIRTLLDRIEDSKTGNMLIDEFYTEIPEQDMIAAKKTVERLGKTDDLPFIGQTQPRGANPLENYLNHSWKPQVTAVGMDGFPATSKAGNVLRPSTTIKLSIRLPPNCDNMAAQNKIKEVLLKDPPYNSQVEITYIESKKGFLAPELSPWLEKAFHSASMRYFGNEEGYMHMGGSIPFMDMFRGFYPDAQFAAMGVLGPNSNAHGPNEMLDLDCTKKLICSLAEIIAHHYYSK